MVEDILGSTSLSGGGGATDVRLVKSSNIFDTSSIASRIMVAAGGGGGNRLQGLPGGAIIGKIYSEYNETEIATQTSAGTGGGFAKALPINECTGAGGGYYSGGKVDYIDTYGKYGFGSWVYIGNEGANINLDGTYYIRYGTSGYWYYKLCTGNVSLSNSFFGDPAFNRVKHGEKFVTQTVSLGTGGSSYISGHSGCIAIKSEQDISPKTDEATDVLDSIHYSGKYFNNTYMCAGDERAEDGQTGNTGNGKCIITIMNEIIDNT